MPKSYLGNFVRAGIIIFAVGALLIAAGFYVALRDRGASYADSFKLLAALNQGLVNGSLLLFAFTLLLSIAGIIVIAVAYSHRVAGPLYKLGRHTRKIATGNLAEPVYLRNTDVIHPLADDLNGVARQYRELLARLRDQLRELSALMDEREGQAPRTGDANRDAAIAARINDINRLLADIKL